MAKRASKKKTARRPAGPGTATKKRATAKRKMTKEARSERSRGTDAAPAIEDIVTALQKSFGRVSERAAAARDEHGDGRAMALVVGRVGFTISCRAEADGDRLVHIADGPIEVQLSGEITTDIRSEADGEGVP